MRLLGKLAAYLLSIAMSLGLGMLALMLVFLAKISVDLPDYSSLRNYQPPVMTRIHASDGTLLAEYSEERRLFVPISAIPKQLIEAYLSAEDKSFFHHGGLDFIGIGRAVLVNVQNLGSGKRLVGASTITQQVAKNFLLTNEVSLLRKVKEQILALRIEKAFSKDAILELYLNDIYLGIGAYGVAAAALSYFDKPIDQLTLAESAYLAALPKAPNNYHPLRFPKKAVERRNWVLSRMVTNGYINKEQADQAASEELGITIRNTGTHLPAADYFSEEVRRFIVKTYGEKALYQGGLSVRSTLDPLMQIEAQRTLIRGLINFDETRDVWRKPLANLAPLGDDWARGLETFPVPAVVSNWQIAIVTQIEPDRVTIGLRPKILTDGQMAPERNTAHINRDGVVWSHSLQGEIKNLSEILRLGDVIYVSADLGAGPRYRLRQIPEISGALVAMAPHTGRVLALSGGFSYELSEFNRATQARRQPGSAFKPFVYAAALDSGYSPSSVIMDAPVEIEQGPGLDIWRPKNYGNKFYGPSTLRTGIEHSRNVMTVQLAADMGMPLVSNYAQRFGIYDELMPVLAMSLGAGETSVLRLVSAYASLANGGIKVTPTLIDRIQDRYGSTLLRTDSRTCNHCTYNDKEDRLFPELVDKRERVLDPMTAYQITSMLEGVVKRGTATNVQAIKRPVAGKTGTTNEEKDAWFIGYTPNLTVGVFVGFDNPKPMGKGATGGRIAAPIFTEFMLNAAQNFPKAEFQVPQGLSLIPINRQTGFRASASQPGTIIEAFKPGTAPPNQLHIVDFSTGSADSLAVSKDAERAVSGGTGGLY